MKVIFSSLDKNKSLGGWQETAVYVEEAFREYGIPCTVLRPPDPSKISTCDIFYEGSYVPDVSRENFNALRAKVPDATYVMQMINAHPNTYYNIYTSELKKYELRDERFGPEWSRSFRSVVAEADAIICHSEWLKQTLIQNLVAESAIRVVPKGVDVNFWLPEPIEHESFRVGFAGQLQIIKGLQYLFEAWTQLKSPGELWVCGPKTEYVEHGKRVWSCGKLYEKYLHSSYKGWFRDRGQLKNFYNAVDVFIAPSLEDGWNMTAVEAMACGIPVITTNTTGMSQIIEEGVDGFIIEPGSTEAIVEKLAWCRDNIAQLKEMGKAARQTVLKYDIATYKQNFIDAILSCVGAQSVYAINSYSPEEWTSKQAELFSGEWFLSAKKRVDEGQKVIQVLKSEVQAGSAVLDVGCLDGSISMLLQEWGCKVVACDLPKVTARTRQLHPDLTIVSVDLNKGFPEGPFDVVFASGVLEHLYNDFFFLCNCCKALRPDGTFIVSSVGFDDWCSAHLRIYPTRQFRTLLTMAGFTHLDFSNSAGQRLIVVARKR